MASKRSASNELNHDNWNQEDEPEERGTFQKASNDTLRNRVIKTARRIRTVTSNDNNAGDNSEKKSAFAGFTGFASKPSITSSKVDDFSFLKPSLTNSAATEVSSPKTNGIELKESIKILPTNISSFITNNSSTTTTNIFKTQQNTTKKTDNIFGATPLHQFVNNDEKTISWNPKETTLSSSVIKDHNSSTTTFSSVETKKSEKYCSKLKGLNESVSKWIVQKVEDNPLISLQPVFKDYEKYLNDIEKEEEQQQQQKSISTNNNNKKTIPMFNFKPADEKSTTTLFGSPSKKEDLNLQSTSIGNNWKSSFDSSGRKFPSSPEKPFSKPQISSTTTTSSPSSFLFGSTGNENVQMMMFNAPSNSSSFDSRIPKNPSSISATTSPTFSFGSKLNNSGGNSSFSAPSFNFGNNNKTNKVEKSSSATGNEETTTTNNDDDEEPPKVEFKAVVEKDFVYTIRCKVFVKNSDGFADRGVGNLYLKPIKDSEKVQLIVRADTNLGNLLLNFILSATIPTKRLGKKDVMLVAIPTSDSKPPPVPILLRVKSSEDADKLLEILENHKK